MLSPASHKSQNPNKVRFKPETCWSSGTTGLTRLWQRSKRWICSNSPLSFSPAPQKQSSALDPAWLEKARLLLKSDAVSDKYRYNQPQLIIGLLDSGRGEGGEWAHTQTKRDTYKRTNRHQIIAG